ncbi:MAG: hypothetical protein V1664_04690 [Candidatus Uhrbacteria bacterium]
MLDGHRTREFLLDFSSSREQRKTLLRLQREIGLFRDLLVEIFKEIPNTAIERTEAEANGTKEKTVRLVLGEKIAKEIIDILAVSPGALKDIDLPAVIERVKEVVRFLSRFIDSRIKKDVRFSPEVCTKISGCVQMSEAEPFEKFSCLQEAIVKLHEAARLQGIVKLQEDATKQRQETLRRSLGALGAKKRVKANETPPKI